MCIRDRDYPYLKIKECPYDIESREQIQTKILDDMEVSITETDTAGYVTSVQVGDETMSGEEFREKYKLASGSFVLQKYDGKLRVTTPVSYTHLIQTQEHFWSMDFRISEM